MSKSVKRLFDQFAPKSYDLEIDINEKSMTFSGKVVISGQKVGRPSKRITLHQKNLKITNAQITHLGKDSKQILVERINTHSRYHEVRLHSKQNIYPGKYVVEIEFNGKITDNMTGLYPCRFKKDGKDKVVFATQFESHHAREVFPCIDEPEAKAVFNLTLTTAKNNISLSNTPIKNQNIAKARVTTTFEPSPIMSSYLLAFVSGEIHCVSTTTKTGVKVSSYATTAQKNSSLKYANDEAVKILEFFEEYFDTPFPLKKLDQIALPDFESGAMENWGLITYREVALLTDPDNRSLPSEQYVSTVVAHEISHQWFGNLVTMKWWDDLWLNESFASLMEHFALDKLHPEWQQWEQYASQDIIACSNRDIYSDVQAVMTVVNHPDEIGTLFDPAIVYAKGGRLLKMMIEFIGEEAFRQGLREYFKQHAYSNTVRDDLWSAMSHASKIDINKLMSPWLTQSGMPVLKVAKISGNQYKLTQSRFLLDKVDDNQLWPIPLLSDDLSIPKIIDSKEITIIADKVPLFNQNGSGHYVVHYEDNKVLDEIISRIKDRPQYSSARINILNDLMLLARRGDDSIVDALKLVSSLSSEERDAVWLIMSRVVGLAGNLGEFNPTIETGLKKLRYTLANKNYQKLGWDDKPNDDSNTKLLRATTIGLMLGSEDKSIVDKAMSIFVNTKNIEDIPSDRRGLVFSTCVKFAKDDEIINTLINKYKSTTDSDLQTTISAALTATKSEKTAQKIIDLALCKDGFVRMQDVFRWYAYLMRNKYCREIAWNWLTKSWPRLIEQFGDSKSLDYFVIYSASPLQTKEWQQKFNKFFDPKINDIALTRSIKIAKSEIAARVLWRERELKPLEAFFKSLL